MTTKDFEQIMDAQIAMCKEILVGKAAEYAGGGDRLHNFECASGLTQGTRQAALAGMMLKHTVSIYDMCNSGLEYPMALWNEKITDHINYLLLLKAVIVDNESLKTTEEIGRHNEWYETIER